MILAIASSDTWVSAAEIADIFLVADLICESVAKEEQN
jgi:hypothetical protein